MSVPKMDWTISLGNVMSMITIIGSITGLYISLVGDINMLKLRDTSATATTLQLSVQLAQVQRDVASTQRDVAVIKDRMEYKRDPLK
jgi:hypothetical protein